MPAGGRSLGFASRGAGAAARHAARRPGRGVAMKLEQNASRIATGRPPKGAPTPGRGSARPATWNCRGRAATRAGTSRRLSGISKGGPTRRSRGARIETLQAAEDRIGKPPRATLPGTRTVAGPCKATWLRWMAFTRGITSNGAHAWNEPKLVSSQLEMESMGPEGPEPNDPRYEDDYRPRRRRGDR